MLIIWGEVQKVGESTYKIELLEDMHISTTFNIMDLIPYIDEDDEQNEYSRANLL